MNVLTDPQLQKLGQLMSEMQTEQLNRLTVENARLEAEIAEMRSKWEETKRQLADIFEIARLTREIEARALEPETPIALTPAGAAALLHDVIWRVDLNAGAEADIPF